MTWKSDAGKFLICRKMPNRRESDSLRGLPPLAPGGDSDCRIGNAPGGGVSAMAAGPAWSPAGQEPG